MIKKEIDQLLAAEIAMENIRPIAKRWTSQEWSCYAKLMGTIRSAVTKGLEKPSRLTMNPEAGR